MVLFIWWPPFVCGNPRYHDCDDHSLQVNPRCYKCGAITYCLNIIFRLAIIAVAWILYLIIILPGFSKDSSTSTSTAYNNSTYKSTSNGKNIDSQPTATEQEEITTDQMKLSTVNNLTLKVGKKDDSGTLKIKKAPASNLKIDDIVLVSKDPDIATINVTLTGDSQIYYEIAGVKAGKTEIYATTKDGTVTSAPVKVNVIAPIAVESLAIQNNKPELIKDDSTFLTLTILPENAEDPQITWTSSDENVATVDQYGAVSAVGDGTATITATAANGVQASTDITVDTSKRLFSVKVSSTRQDNNNIGSDWTHMYTINGEQPADSMLLKAGDTLSCYANITEEDTEPDIGENSTNYTITDEDLLNGFSVSMDVYVSVYCSPQNS